MTLRRVNWQLYYARFRVWMYRNLLAVFYSLFPRFICIFLNESLYTFQFSNSTANLTILFQQSIPKSRRTVLFSSKNQFETKLKISDLRFSKIEKKKSTKNHIKSLKERKDFHIYDFHFHLFFGIWKFKRFSFSLYFM